MRNTSNTAGRALVALTALALLAGGCTPDDSSGPTATPTTSTASTEPSGPSEPTSDPDAGGRDDIVEPPTSSAPAATWDESSELSALETATDFVTAYLDTSQPAAQWLAGITPYLDPSEIATFSTVDPMNIPYGAVTGAAERVVDDIDSPYVAVVTLPVDDTAVTVTLARSDGEAAWLVVDLAQG